MDHFFVELILSNQPLWGNCIYPPLYVIIRGRGLVIMEAWLRLDQLLWSRHTYPLIDGIFKVWLSDDGGVAKL